MVTVPYRAIDACRICAGRELTEVIDLGESALTGCFPRLGEPDSAKAPLVVLRCEGCGLVQLKHSVSPSELYTESYGYRSSINRTMREHLAGIAGRVRELVSLSRNDVVLDIGCNDGTLLGSYPKELARFGIDPIAEKFRRDYYDDLDVATGYFDASTFDELAGGRKAKVITSIAMFYDLEDPGQFIRDIASSLDNDGIWVLEQSYMPRMLELNSYDTICHEHLEYYALAQIEQLAVDQGLRVMNVEFSAINGGSFRLYICHESGSHATRSDVLGAIRIREKEAGLTDFTPYSEFSKRVFRLRDELHQFVSGEVSKGRRIHLYGASTKGNTILQFCDLDHHLIEAASDRNPDKWHARTPATAIPIISEEESRTAKPDYYLVLPWHFREEFLLREKAFRDAGGKLIFPLPEMEVL